MQLPIGFDKKTVKKTTGFKLSGLLLVLKTDFLDFIYKLMKRSGLISGLTQSQKLLTLIAMSTLATGFTDKLFRMTAAIVVIEFNVKIDGKTC